MMPRLVPSQSRAIRIPITRSRETDVLNNDISQTQNAELKKNLLMILSLRLSLLKKVLKHAFYKMQIMHSLSRAGKSCLGVPG